MKANTNKQAFKVKVIEAGVTQKELAEEFKVSIQTFNGWVSGRVTPPLNTALRIAKRLNCSVHDLWEYKEE